MTRRAILRDSRMHDPYSAALKALAKFLYPDNVPHVTVLSLQDVGTF